MLDRTPERIPLPAVTGPTAALAALFDPLAFIAVTKYMMVLPTSPAWGTYVVAVAPGIATPPECHRRTKLVGLFVQVPSLPVSALPTAGVPLIEGLIRLFGALDAARMRPTMKGPARLGGPRGASPCHTARYATPGVPVAAMR